MPVSFWRNSKPPAGTPIDFSHPLARGLVLAFPFNQYHGAPVDSVRGLRLTPKGQLNDTLRWGQGAGFINAANTNGAEATCPDYAKLAMPITIVWQGLKLGLPTAGSNAGIFGVSFDNANTTPFLSYSFIYNSTTSVYLYGGNGATQSASSGTLPANGPLWLAATIENGRQALYVNTAATPAGTGTGTTAITYSSTSLVYVGNYTNIVRNSNTRSDLGYIWNRALTLSELQWIEAEPYAMFAPPVWRRYFVPAAVAGKSLVMPSPAWRRKTRYRVLR